MFQCLIGCRVSDLNRLTKANIVDGCVEYIPQKTKLEHANTVRVPLNQKALDILERYKDLEGALLPRFSHFGYNKKIKEILKYVGIDRMVRVLDPKTREDVAKPLYEVATTHTARKTFIGNLYKQVKDPNLIASMSGAFGKEAAPLLVTGISMTKSRKTGKLAGLESPARCILFFPYVPFIINYLQITL